MDHKVYTVSDTQKTAEWKEKQGWFGHYNCTNCGHGENPGYPAHSFRLGNFCPNCGFRMLNPQLIMVEQDYGD